MKMLGFGLLCAIAAALAATPGYCTGVYTSEILRANEVSITTSATDQAIITIQNMTQGDYDCSGNGGFDQGGGAATIYHIKAAVSPTATLSGAHAAGKTSIQVPTNGSYITIDTGTWRLVNTTTASLVINAYFDTGTATAFGYLQCVGPQ